MKPLAVEQHVHILRSAEGKYFGRPEVAGNASWEDMPHANQALNRNTGEFLVLAQED